VIEAIAVVCVVFIGFGVLASIAAVIERLPNFPPMYDDDDVIAPPNVRSQRSGRESH
jgi:hypothetical protein